MMTDIEKLSKMMEPLKGSLNIKDGILDAILCGASPMADDDLEAIPGHASVSLLEIDETAVTDRGLRCLAKFPALDTLIVGRTVVSGAGIPESTLENLTTLYLDECSGVTDDSLAFLSKCRSLKVLWLQRTAITDAGLKHVAQVVTLRSLRLDDTAVSDDGLPLLSSLTSLTHLDLTFTKTTDAGWHSLKQHLPALMPAGRLYDAREEFRWRGPQGSR